VLCTAWKNTVEGDVQSYVNEYKRTLLEALVREGVHDWNQVKRGLASIKSPFLPNPNDFAANCAGTGEITGTWGTGAHREYKPERLIENTTSTDRRSRLAEVMGLLS